MERSLIQFQRGNVLFRVRVSGVVIHRGHVLFQHAIRHPDDLFWFLPGGRAELGEHSTETLQREMMEELGVPVTVKRLLFIIENLYHREGKRSHHEIEHCFLMELPEDSYLLNTPGPYDRTDSDPLGDEPLVFNWLPLDHLEQFDIRPAIYHTLLHSLPEQPMHVVYMQ